MIEVCIIGFGFSSIPLIRELERTKTEFQIISEENDTIWDRLNEIEALDFNLVSSYQTSFYSFDLVKDYEQDYYPTAEQFYEMHKRWRAVYEEKVIKDFVIRVDNFKDHSLIVTRSGKNFKARHVVIATGFHRLMNKTLKDFDYSVKNKTFVFGTMGDSANLMISKLIPNNNKIIVRMNGFSALDKQFLFAGTSFTLDQMEFHNGRYISHKLYNALIMSPIYRKAANPAVLFNQFPLVNRDYSWVSSKLAPANGTIFIKYWPIDEYCRNFGDDLEESISKGYLLNDIAMWIHTGKVIIVPPDTPIDFEGKTITYAGVERSFDQYIKGDAEQPRLPTINIDGVTPYQYVYRDNFMGVIPQKLNNIYLLGLTRPITAGLANIVEMQGLFIHKLVTQPEFHSKIYQDLSERIAAYNYYHYGTTEPRKSDHTTHYGCYIDDIARLIGIDYKPSDCKSIKDLIFYYAFPNNAFKYRLKGEYAIDGIKELIEKVNSNHGNFVIVFSLLFNAGCMNIDDFDEWIHKSKRFFFNDMRHKEGYRKFLDAYIDAYRRVKNISVEETVDKEWDVMVNEACRLRDKVADKIDENTDCQLEEDLSNGMNLILPLLNSDISCLLDSNNDEDSYNNPSGLNFEQINFIRSMWKPPEYDLPYVHGRAVAK